MGYIEQTPIDRDLVLEFFLRFSRFEFALKVSGYADGDTTRVSPAWDRFARDIAEMFDKGRTPDLQSACEYYLLNPPMKQVLANGTLSWSTDLPVEPNREVELLIGLVRRVRNNLFHGGKYNAELHEETARKEELLRGAIEILGECLRASKRVGHAYESAAI